MSKSYPMTDDSFAGKLNDFKARVDNMGVAMVDLVASASVKKVGGLYHWKLGRLGGSLYVKRPVAKGYVTREPKVIEPTVTTSIAPDRLKLAMRG